MNKRDVLFIRPSDCRYCKQGFYGLGHVVNYAQTKSFNIDDLQGTQADNPYIDEHVNSFNPYLIYGNGHGNVNVFTANSETPVWVVGEDLTHLTGRIIYLMSCLTANQLGPYMIDQGALSYGGFLISWTWMTGDVNGDPYTDTYAEGFWKGANKFFEALLDGMTMAQAMQASVDEYNHWIDWWSNSGIDGASDVIKWLIHDRDGLIIYGDQNASTIKCDEIDNKSECIDAGCWWYNEGCHCEPPGNIQSTFDFIIDVYPAKAKIVKYDSYYPVGYRIPEDNYTWVDYNMRIGNSGRGTSTIFIKATNEDVPPDSPDYIIFNRTITLKPGQVEKHKFRRSHSHNRETHKLVVGHLEEGVKVVDDEAIHENTAVVANRLGDNPYPHPYVKLEQRESRDNIFAVRRTVPEDCEAVAIEYYALETLYLPDPIMGAAIYKVSDGSLVAKVDKPFEFSGVTAKRRIHFDNSVPLQAGEEYWFAVSRRINAYGLQYHQRTDGAEGIGARMAHDPENPMPDTFIPETTENECYIWCIYI